MERKSKKKLREECWDLDIAFLKWLNIHLKVYLKDASKHIDLDFHKFKYKGRIYTQKEIIKMLIVRTGRALKMDWLDKGYEELINEIFDLWKLVFSSMWW